MCNYCCKNCCSCITDDERTPKSNFPLFIENGELKCKPNISELGEKLFLKFREMSFSELIEYCSTSNKIGEVK